MGDRKIVENTNVPNLNEYGAQATKNVEWINYCSKLDISVSQACDMKMVTDTNNTTKCANMDSETSFDGSSEVISMPASNLDVSFLNTNSKWIASSSKLEISSLQSYDRKIVENTNVPNLNEYGAQATKNVEWINYCSKLDI